MYSSQTPPDTGNTELETWLQRQLQEIEQSFVEQRYGGLAKVYEEPTRPREGMFANADGTTWNPGAGAGIYVYHNSTWKKVHA